MKQVSLSHSWKCQSYVVPRSLSSCCVHLCSDCSSWIYGHTRAGKRHQLQALLTTPWILLWWMGTYRVFDFLYPPEAGGEQCFHCVPPLQVPGNCSVLCLHSSVPHEDAGRCAVDTVGCRSTYHEHVLPESFPAALPWLCLPSPGITNPITSLHTTLDLNFCCSKKQILHLSSTYFSLSRCHNRALQKRRRGRERKTITYLCLGGETKAHLSATSWRLTGENAVAWHNLPTVTVVGDWGHRAIVTYL